MRRQDADANATIDLIYDAVLDEQAWPRLLGRLEPHGTANIEFDLLQRKLCFAETRNIEPRYLDIWFDKSASPETNPLWGSGLSTPIGVFASVRDSVDKIA